MSAAAISPKVNPRELTLNDFGAKSLDHLPVFHQMKTVQKGAEGALKFTAEVVTPMTDGNKFVKLIRDIFGILAMIPLVGAPFALMNLVIRPFTTLMKIVGQPKNAQGVVEGANSKDKLKALSIIGAGCDLVSDSGALFSVASSISSTTKAASAAAALAKAAPFVTIGTSVFDIVGNAAGLGIAIRNTVRDGRELKKDKAHKRTWEQIKGSDDAKVAEGTKRVKRYEDFKAALEVKKTQLKDVKAQADAKANVYAEANVANRTKRLDREAKIQAAGKVKKLFLRIAEFFRTMFAPRKDRLDRKWEAIVNKIDLAQKGVDELIAKASEKIAKWNTVKETFSATPTEGADEVDQTVKTALENKRIAMNQMCDAKIAKWDVKKTNAIKGIVKDVLMIALHVLVIVIATASIAVTIASLCTGFGGIAVPLALGAVSLGISAVGVGIFLWKRFQKPKPTKEVEVVDLNKAPTAEERARLAAEKAEQAAQAAGKVAARSLVLKAA